MSRRGAVAAALPRLLWWALAAVCALPPAVAASPPNRDAPGRVRRAERAGAIASGPEIRDPLFELLIAIAEHDSLGAWDAAALTAYVTRSGRATRLPLQHLQRIERRATPAGDAPGGGREQAPRVWRFVFASELAFPMPYSILGYHPGTLRLSRELVWSEWRLGAADLRLASDESGRVFAYTGVFCWRLDEGRLVLDVDGWLDRLLGAALDDSWTDGLALGRLDGRLVGLAMGANPQGRPLMGEFDFRDDKVLAHGRPAARALAGFCRPYTAPPDGSRARVWP